MPIFWGHGRLDRQVEYEFSVKAAETLASDLNIPFHTMNERLALEQFKIDSSNEGLIFVTYDPLGHWIQTPEEMQDLGVWIEACLPHNGGEGMSKPVATSS